MFNWLINSSRKFPKEFDPFRSLSCKSLFALLIALNSISDIIISPTLQKLLPYLLTSNASSDAGELFVNLSNNRLYHSTAETSTMDSEPMTKVFNFVPSYKATPAKTWLVSIMGDNIVVYSYIHSHLCVKTLRKRWVRSYYPQQLLRNGQARRASAES